MVVPDRIGAYLLERKVGEGPHGVVYQVSRFDSDRKLVMKVLRPELCRDESRLERFSRDVDVLGNLSHRNLVEVVDQGSDKGHHFVVTEFLEGTPLSQKLQAGGLPWAQACEWVNSALKALQIAHDHGVSHGNLKPANLMVDQEQQVVVTDFSLTQLLPADQEPTPESLAYCAPELLTGGPGDPKGDSYACALMLYELLAGAHPFRRTGLQATKEAIRNEVVAPLPGLPEGLSEAVLKGLSREPSARATCSGLSRELSFIVMSEAEPAPAPESAESFETGREYSILLVSAPAESEGLPRVEQALLSHRPQHHQWLDEVALLVFTELQPALECALSLRRGEDPSDQLRLVVVTGEIEPDPVSFMRRPKLDNLACPTVDIGYSILQNCPPGRLRICAHSGSQLHDRNHWVEGGDGVWQYDSGPEFVAPEVVVETSLELPPAEAPPAPEPEPEPEPPPPPPPPPRKAVLNRGPVPMDDRPKTIPVPLMLEPERRFPWKWFLLLLVGLSLGGLYWKFLRAGTLTLDCKPAKVAVRIDGKKRIEYSKGEPIPLWPGKHKLMVAAEGFKPQAVQVTIEPGGEHSKAVNLVKVPKKKPPPKKKR